jgi:hypothetical protein
MIERCGALGGVLQRPVGAIEIGNSAISPDRSTDGAGEVIVEVLASNSKSNSASRMRVRQLAAWSAFVIAQLWFCYCLVPCFDRIHTFQVSELTPEYKRVLHELSQKNPEDLFHNSRTQGSWAPREVYDASPLVQVRWVLYGIVLENGERTVKTLDVIKIRYNRILLWTVFSIILALTLFKMPRRVDDG